MFGIDLIFAIAILIMSVVIHEVSHGYMAYYLGDPTAKYAGRLTLNPLKHLDPIGSVLVPIVTSFAGFAFGWAKPVPYNPYNLRHMRRDELLVAAAGPLSNISIAALFGIIMRFGIGFGLLSLSFVKIASLVVVINLVLAIFNLIPIPPLDGSKILFNLLPRRFFYVVEFLSRYGFIILLFFIFFLWGYLTPLIAFMFRLITGMSF